MVQPDFSAALMSMVNSSAIAQKEHWLLPKIYPNPMNPEKFVLLYSATTKPAEKLIGLFSTLYAGAGLPDFIVYDKTALKYGWGGVKAAGFFDKDWKFDKKLSYVEN
jgi:hypothetical protein